MFSFELKTVIAAAPSKVFAVLTQPRFLTQWDYCRWVRNDRCLGGRVRKRDEEGRLTESEIIVYQPPFRYAVVTNLPLNPEEPEEGQFPVRLEYGIDAYENQSALTLAAEGFASQALADRERNSWGGYFLEKLKKVAEKA
jgi:uncharacterized protein YndB with AHSA1/START domain